MTTLTIIYFRSPGTHDFSGIAISRSIGLAALLSLSCVANASPPATPASSPQAVTMESALLDPWVPPNVRQSAAASAKAASPTQGVALRAQVERKLKISFDAADTDNKGSITRAQALAAGLGFITRHFDAIDQRKKGAVSFDEIKNFMRFRGAQLD